MRDPKVKNNYFTKPDRRPPKSPDRGEIEGILKLYGKKGFSIHGSRQYMWEQK